MGSAAVDAPTFCELIFGKADEPLSDLGEDDRSPETGGGDQKGRRLSPAAEENILRGFHRQDRKSISAARAKPVIFETFNLRQSVDSAYGNAPRPATRVPELVTNWLDGLPRIAVDVNDIPIVLHIPQWQKEKSLCIFNEICHQLAEVTPPTTRGGADRKCRNLENSYRREEGELCGQIKIATGWHAIGHPNDTPVPSASILASGRKFVASMKALFEFRVTTRRLNGVLDILDEDAADQYKRLRAVAAEEMDYLRAIDTLDPSYWQGRVILFNRQTPRHRDTRNPPAEWTPLHAAGNFTGGGSLFIHELNLRLRYLPGDLIFLRGSLLSHSVEPWSGGQRISVAYFSHESFWKFFNRRLSL